MEQIASLMYRHLNCLREIQNLTKELEESIRRNDNAAVSLLLRQRAEQMERADRCMEELRMLARTSPEMDTAVNRLFAKPPVPPGPEAPKEEQRAYELRMAEIKLIKELRPLDERLNRRITGTKSFYK